MRSFRAAGIGNTSIYRGRSGAHVGNRHCACLRDSWFGYYGAIHFQTIGACTFGCASKSKCTCFLKCIPGIQSDYQWNLVCFVLGLQVSYCRSIYSDQFAFFYCISQSFISATNWNKTTNIVDFVSPLESARTVCRTS